MHSRRPARCATFDAANQDLTLVNKPALRHALYVSPADQNEWGEDILGDKATTKVE
jgi:hypothetical protein